MFRRIVKIIIIFPKTLKCDVIPVDNPTVPNADVLSNNNCIKVNLGSTIHNKNVLIMTTHKDKIATTKACIIIPSDILRLNETQCW